jgi:hypothetical protein
MEAFKSLAFRKGAPLPGCAPLRQPQDHLAVALAQGGVWAADGFSFAIVGASGCYGYVDRTFFNVVWPAAYPPFPLRILQLNPG